MTFESSEHISVSTDSAVLRLQFNRPDRKNAITRAMYTTLADAIEQAAAELAAQGYRVLGDGSPRIGAHGKPVLFLHPSDFCGTLIELEEV